MKKNQLPEKAKELLEKGSVLITGADIKDGVVERIQVYFADDGEAVMDIISKDDLVQNFPDEGVFALCTAADGKSGEFRQVGTDGSQIDGDGNVLIRGKAYPGAALEIVGFHAVGKHGAAVLIVGQSAHGGLVGTVCGDQIAI